MLTIFWKGKLRMDRFRRVSLVCCWTLLFVGLSCSLTTACSDKFAITAPEQYVFDISTDELSAVPSGMNFTQSGLLNIQIEVPGQGNQGNKWTLTWRLDPISGSDHPVPSGGSTILSCQNSTSGNVLKEGIGDQNVAVQLILSLPADTPPGEYAYRVTFTASMGNQGQGTPVSDTTKIIIKVPAFARIWTTPTFVQVGYAGPDRVGAKEDLVYVYVRSNVSWKVMFRMTDPSPILPLDAIVVQTSSGVTGTIGQWAPVQSSPLELGFGPSTGESWILLKLRCNSSCSLAPGDYPFKFGFELEANN